MKKLETRTEIDFWKSYAASIEPPPWHSRFEKMVRYIRPNDNVVDFGCGNQYLKTLLCRTAGYQPVDCVHDSGENVFVCDYNAEFRIPEFPATVLFFGGFFEYIYDLPEFMRKITDSYPGVFCIFSYAYSPLVGREANRWVNNLGNRDQVLYFFGGYLDGLRQVDEWEDHTRQMICTGQVRGRSS